jgi:hypothetical protein
VFSALLKSVVLVPSGQVDKGMGVLVERCRYLEQSGCASICINSCKVPTQASIPFSYACRGGNNHLGDPGICLCLLVHLFCTFVLPTLECLNVCKAIKLSSEKVYALPARSLVFEG